MTTLLAIFCVALILAIVLTPLTGRLGARFGALDEPAERKVHGRPIPRTGGLAIFVVFALTLVISRFFNTNVSDLLVLDKKTVFLLGGAVICFGAGLFDDFHRLGPYVKLLFQIIAASVAYWGGIRIGGFNVLGVYIKVGLLSYFITVFWFILLINAVNLVDGLDGLAGGIVVFTSVVMVILSVLRGDFLTAILFTALGGSVLGFLRYNFNPATIFLGDGGSYFLGYAIAGFSIMGSAKSQVGAAILIPLLALGVPLFDTILSPLRRFIRGRDMFRPDNGHIHHRLLDMGLTTKKAVLFIYMLTFVLCIMAVVMVNIRDEQAGLFLIILGAGAVIFVRKLGYFEYLGSDKIFGWFKDLTDTAGISQQRRSFLSLQIDAGRSENFEELWQNITTAFKMLEFDKAELHLNSKNPSKFELQKEWAWMRDGFDEISDIRKECLFKVELPLLGTENKNFGTLWLIKDLERDAISHYTLRRVEHLRRTLVGTLEKLSTGSAPTKI
ncbi:MAG: MraY family glycosyltransferase [Desulfobacterales bacterium]